MANYCEYVMRITGPEEAVERFCLEPIGRIYLKERLYSSYTADGLYYCELSGDCAWSVESSMDVSNPLSPIRSLAMKEGLIIEIWSSEPGMCFQEHYIIEMAALTVNEEEEYREYNIYDYDIEEIREDLGNSDITEEDADDCGYIKIGGFGDDWGHFDNLTMGCYKMALISNGGFVDDATDNTEVRNG